MWPVKWTKVDKHDRHGSFKAKNSLLKLTRLSEADFGDYTCTSYNLFGLADITLTVSRNGFTVSAQNYKPSLKRKLNKQLKRNKKQQNTRLAGLELRKRRFKKRFELVKHKKL